MNFNFALRKLSTEKINFLETLNVSIKDEEFFAEDGLDKSIE